MSEEQIELTAYAVRYFSIVTVPKEFVHQMPQIEGAALASGASLNGEAIQKAISQGTSQVSSLTPYLFVLFEVENQRAYWTYMDMAGELSKIQFIDGKESYVAAQKVVYPNGGYVYQVHQILLARG